MINIIPSDERYHADHGWLDTRWHFSFGDYHDPDNMNWGPLRVFNDDIIQGGGAFGMHPHRDMEIITYMISGQLQHADSMGHVEKLNAGEVQVMSAGNGLMHSEANASATEPLRLLQFWIIPRTRGGKPRWDQRPFTHEQRKNKLFPIVSSGNIPGTLAIDQDAAVYVASLEKGKELTYRPASNRHAYLFVIAGEAALNGKPLHAGDQARIADEPELKVVAKSAAELILLDLP